MVTIAGNVTSVTGKGLVRHDGKTEAALRVIPLPSFAVDMLTTRHEKGVEDAWPVFATGGWGSTVLLTLGAMVLAGAVTYFGTRSAAATHRRRLERARA